MTGSTRTSRSAVPRTPSPRSRPAATAAEYGGPRRLPWVYTSGHPDDTPRLRLTVAAGTALPPLPVQAGGAEMLSGGARHLHTMVRTAGGDCTLDIWPGQVHVFQALPRLAPEADAALGRAAEFLCAASTVGTPRKVS
ncbi:hypothetical protein AB0H42_08430 [Nocardia sp. NPDC050799]|uniref:alpha/beta hydrolase n=1 Tax=Nocardia sp. NPDC050799 TaxID=3154842 RepID=UPI0033CA83E3